jgi:glycosyltransferase involved in cell wall biosynthesis
MLDKITIITIVFNNVKNIQKTIDSVYNQTYSCLEYIIIDGGSTDGTMDIINKNKDKISLIISEQDNGIYDAMNKGILKATGIWLNFMNSGDIFFDNVVLENALIYSEFDLIYSDTYLSNSSIFKCDIDKNRIIHQSLIYKKKLHNDFGLYINSKGFSIADYFFFMLCKNKKWIKIHKIISIFELEGTSSNIEHFKQKIAVDVLFNNKGRITASILLLCHPIYNKIKRLLK